MINNAGDFQSDNYEDEISKLLLCDKEKIKIKLLNGIVSFDELIDKIFIDNVLEVEFNN